MSDEPRLEIIKLPDLLGGEWRAERARQRDEARRRYRDRVAATLMAIGSSGADATTAAEAVIDSLFVVMPVEGDGPCSCSCHPHLPDGDLHDYGFGCSCKLTPEERGKSFSRWMAEMDVFWESPEGQALSAARAEEETALRSWLEADPDVTVTSHGGMAPEQWHGSVDGHTFYFRERHDHWRIEIDLRPSGRSYRAWVGGELDDDANYEEREVEEGDVIAEGTTTDAGYGGTPAERARFIVDTIRAHLGRQGCEVHLYELDDLECLFGRPLNWCPACGLRLHPDRPGLW